MITLSVSEHDITKGYKSWVVPFSRVGEVTAKYNYSAATFKNGYRDGDHVAALGSVMIYDFDDGVITIDEVADFLLNNKISAIIATSKSHQKEKNGKPPCDRFRLFVPFDRRIKINHSDYSDFYMYMAKFLRIDDKIDVACKDRSRFYYPNHSQVVRYLNTGMVLDADVFERNFELFKHKTAKQQPKKANPPKKQKQQQQMGLKNNEIPRDTQIELKGGEIKYLYEFEYLTGNETVPCRCVNPAHEDKNPSAFVGRSKTGKGLQIACKGCGNTVYAPKDK